ncbi:MAG: Ig-like domain-containing protein [Thermoanaerobaculia bacterium]
MRKVPVGQSGFLWMCRISRTLRLLLLGCALPGVAGAQLNEHCTVSILNRTAQAQPDGSWRIDNVPANFGLVRARATCVENGVTRSGQSDYFSIQANVVNGFDTQIHLGNVDPIPASLTLTAPTLVLSPAQPAAQLTATALYPDGHTSNVTAGGNGTTYTISNPGIATITPNGLVTAVSSGSVLVSATKDGALGILQIVVRLTGDADGDGIPDDLEVANGLNPSDPLDALQDPDGDGLTNKQELVDFGTDIHKADSDGDGILDGEEVVAGADGFVTNPLRADTDGDGVRDALEIATGSDPTNAASLNLSRALDAIAVSPAAFTMTVNTILGEASRQLAVTGHLRDGNSIDLTSTVRGTNYASSNLGICNFGSPDGRVFAGADGSCVLTATSNGFTAQAQATVRTFAPRALSFLDIPGFANNVDVSGDYAYVAAGATGLQVVSVANRQAPRIVGSRDTPGNADDVVVNGTLAYVADGASGLQILDVSDPAAPVIVGAVDTPGNAQDVVVRGTLAYVADGASGLQVIDVTDPTAPVIVGTVDTPGGGRGVDVAPERGLAAVADGPSGLRLVDISDPAHPRLRGTVATGDARDVVLQGNVAYVADYSSSLTTVDVTDPAAPVILGRTSQSLGGLLADVAVVNGFAFGADVFFVNGVPIVDVTQPASPLPRAILNFAGFRDDNGTGIAVDSNYVYLTAAAFALDDNGTSGTTRLYIGQYLEAEDLQGRPPVVRITSPAPGATAIEETNLAVTADATDDVAVAGVDFLVNGQVVASDSAAPYQATVTVPKGVSTLTLGARARDLGGNTGLAPEVTIGVVPDPLTTVAGRVVDSAGNPLAGATVKANGGVTATAAGDGTFSIPGVPTIRGPITVSATATVAGTLLSGRSAPTPPVPGGVTQVGDVAVRSRATVGYYDLDWNGGNPAQVPPIQIAGYDAVDVGDLGTADLSRFDILFVQNPNNGGYSSIYLQSLPKVHQFIQNGGVLVFHDRAVSSAASILPGSPGTFVRDFSDDKNIDIVNNTTRVTNGPGGVLTNTSLDNGNSSSHGYVLSTTVPADALGILSQTSPQRLVLYSYGYGRGKVIYSTIPLDYYLEGFGPVSLNINMQNYAANVLAYANDVR